MVDEAEPMLGDEIAAVVRTCGDARKDLDEELVGEPLQRHAAVRRR